MPSRLRSIALVSALSLGVAPFVTTDAHACGGCFHLESDPETTVVTGHRMAFAISPTQTVLWDQVSYTGSPQGFAWVLPIKQGARIELGTNSWFESLDAATSTVVVAPQLDCVFAQATADGGGNACCGDGDVAKSGGGFPPEAPPPPPVTVIKRETVGPYEVVTLSTDVPGALVDWLKQNGYAIDAAITPIIDQYTAEGFDFIAMKLIPGKTVQNMQPVRVVSPGASPVLPLRMVAAGTGANTAVTLFVIGEGRWEAKNFPNVLANANSIAWDFATNSSTYGQVRSELLAQQNGSTWLTSFAREEALLSPLTNPQGQPVTYEDNSTTIAEFYVSTGQSNKETSDVNCTKDIAQWAESINLVVDPCDNGGAGGAGGMAGSGGGSMQCVLENGQIDKNDFACIGTMGEKTFDDLAVALTGLHPASVWVTRLEANLSRSALENDLELQPASQSEVSNWFVASQVENAPCPIATAAKPTDETYRSARDRRKRSELAAIVVMVAGIALATSRRARRPAADAFAT
jgi:hypothetical protein